MSKWLSIALISFILVGCGSTQQIQVSTVAEQIQIAQPDRPRPLRLNSLSFKVVSASNLEEFVQEFQGNPNRRWYILSPGEYQRLLDNMAEMRRYIQQQNSVIVYYEDITASRASPQQN